MLYEDDPENGIRSEDSTYEHESNSESDALEYDSEANDDEPKSPTLEAKSDQEPPVWTFRICGPTPPDYDTNFLPLSACWADESLSSRERYDKARQYEHIAGPDCQQTQGYQGHRISVEEMRGCHTKRRGSS